MKFRVWKLRGVATKVAFDERKWNDKNIYIYHINFTVKVLFVEFNNVQTAMPFKF